MRHDRLQNGRILIVDDQEANVKVLEGLLRKHGNQHYRSTLDPREVLSLYQEFQPDLILLDLLMPYLDGFAVMEQLREVIPPDSYLPILVLTADVTPEAKRRALSVGAKDFLTKPFDHTEALLRINNLLESRFLHLQLQSQNQTLEQKVHERTREIEALERLSEIALGEERTLEEALQEMAREIAYATDFPIVTLGLYDAARQQMVYKGVQGLSLPAGQKELVQPISHSLAGLVVQRDEGIIERAVPERAGQDDLLVQAGARCYLGVPMRGSQGILGVLSLAGGETRKIEERLRRFATSLANRVTVFLERKQAEERIHHQLQRLAALRAVDTAITASLDLRVTLNILLDQITTHLKVDAAAVLLLNPHIQILEYAAGRGFSNPLLPHASLRLGEGYAGHAALERRMVQVTRVDRVKDFKRVGLITGEGFITYYGLPLVAKGQVQGVLEIYHRSELNPDPDWLAFLETLAGQAAIAIDNAWLFDGLQRSNLELMLAYDATIEGWSRALDLRDKETEGHSLRVTEVTVRLARLMGVAEAELVHVHRGALLHDIGKMGVPDGILLKPGPLDEKEWEIMRRHPIYARELLSQITFLRPALDIPYCHHEKWDGTGYPRGLQGEEIPLGARIFAVVDVWDALCSDRPYRPGWPEEKVLDYVKEQSDRHFDPHVVEAFLRLAKEPGALYPSR